MNSIISHIISFAIGLTTGILGSYVANRLSEKAKKKDKIKDRKNEFKAITAKMPDLIKEMKNDLSNPEMSGCRGFFISPSKSVTINTKNPAFLYFENEHENLKSKIRILENAGFVFDITPGNAPKYQFDEEFVEYLLK
jgi:hypothetical protein